MKYSLKRREFISGSLLGLLGLVATKSLKVSAADAAKAGAITDKDILKEGKPAPVANYCENPTKQPNKICPGAKDRPGKCSDCQFYMKDTETTFKGKKYAKCQIIPAAPNYVMESGWCATYTKRA